LDQSNTAQALGADSLKVWIGNSFLESINKTRSASVIFGVETSIGRSQVAVSSIDAWSPEVLFATFSSGNGDFVKTLPALGSKIFWIENGESPENEHNH